MPNRLTMRSSKEAVWGFCFSYRLVLIVRRDRTPEAGGKELRKRYQESRRSYLDAIRSFPEHGRSADVRRRGDLLVWRFGRNLLLPKQECCSSPTRSAFPRDR